MKKIVFIIVFLPLLLVSCNQQKVLQYQFVDTDLDGVPDHRDACPNEPGSPFNLGCPQKTVLSDNYNKLLSTDSDLDGVPDDKDECPYEYGSPFNMGCPF